MKKELKQQIEKEERWIDFLEGELEPSLAEDLGHMLESDEEIKALVEEYKGIKAYMAKIDDSGTVPEDESYYDSLQEKIMAQVTETEMQAVPVSSFNKRNINYMLVAVFVCVFSVTAIMRSLQETNGVDSSKQVAQLSFKQLLKTAKVDDVSSVGETVISHESEMDFMMNADLEMINNLSDKELEDLMGKL